MGVLNSFFLVLLAAVSGCTVLGQPAVNLYAFEQATLPGTISTAHTNENGGAENPSKRGTKTYYIYLAYSLKQPVTPVSLFIKGSWYHFQTDLLKNTTAFINHPNVPGQTLVLVPNQKNKLLRLLPDTLLDSFSTQQKPPKRGLDSMQIVVGYEWKGKTYYKGAAEIKTIEPELNQ